MSMKRLPLVAILLVTVASSGWAQRLASPDHRGDDFYLRDPAADSSVDLTGIVSSVDRDRESIRLRTSRGLQTVELYDGTLMSFDSGRRAGLSDVRVGDDLEVKGDERGGRIVADRVTLLGPSGARSAEEDSSYPQHDGVLVGTVRTPTYDVSRRIKVRTAEGDVTVTADPHTPIYQAGELLSVHDLDRGDRVRVVGRWEGRDRLRASRIDVGLPPPPIREKARGYRSNFSAGPMPVITVLGTLVSYDDNRDRMRLSTREGDRIVVAKGTPAYVRGNRISRGNMRQGDRVRATGYWNGHELLATRVELAY
jgi:hypothetical protein